MTKDDVLRVLGNVMEPELHQDLVTLNMVRNIEISGKDLGFTVMLTTPACPLKQVIQRDCESALRQGLPELENITVDFDSEVSRDRRVAEKLHLPIANVIAVGSGKGGVGKTTVSLNLAIALAREGARVGLLDADIYGPNVPNLIGEQEVVQKDGKLMPIKAFGVDVMSMGYLIPADEALVWRGPMIHGALSQLFTEVAWSELDYLVVDLPPGTGDAQLSLAQLVPLTGGVLVTTPQQLSLADARRGANAFERLEVPLLGVIENMSGEIFGQGGGKLLADEVGTDFIGSIALDSEIARANSSGEPLMASQPDSEPGQLFSQFARFLAGKISMLNHQEAMRA